MLVEPQTRGLDIISIVCESSNCSISGETHIHNHANIALTVTQRFASFLQEFPSLFVVLGNELLNVQGIIHMNEGVELFCWPVVHNEPIRNRNQVLRGGLEEM